MFGKRVMNMKSYPSLSKGEMKTLYTQLMKEYEAQKAKGYHLDMSRGKPDTMQLNLSMDILAQNPYDLIFTRKGTDVRN